MELFPLTLAADGMKMAVLDCDSPQQWPAEPGPELSIEGTAMRSTRVVLMFFCALASLLAQSDPTQPTKEPIAALPPARAPHVMHYAPAVPSGPASRRVAPPQASGLNFAPAVDYHSGGYNTYALAVAVADVNGDGKPDLVVTNQCASNSNCTNGTVGVLLNNGDGTLQTAVTYGSGGAKPFRLRWRT